MHENGNKIMRKIKIKIKYKGVLEGHEQMKISALFSYVTNFICTVHF